MKKFTQWAMDHGARPMTAEDWDDLLWDYRLEHADLSKGNFGELVASLEFFLPSVKHQLPWSRAVLAGWSRTASTRHTMPLTRQPPCLVAAHICSRGKSRLALGLLLQVRTGLRPSEMLKLMLGHFMFPEDTGSVSVSTATVIALGAKMGTKVKRSQVVMLSPTHVHLTEALRQCRLHTPADCFMFPYTLATMRNELRAVEKTLGLKVGWSPHSGRAGFVTDCKTDGVDFVTTREAGRWVSDSSLRPYLDVVSATMVLKTLRLQGLSSQMLAAEALWPSYFGLPV